MKTFSLSSAFLLFLTVFASNSFARDDVQSWSLAAQRAKNLVSFINNKVDQIAFGGRTQCHRIENAQQCIESQGCSWDREFDVCAYRNNGGGGGFGGRNNNHFRGFESDLGSESEEIDFDDFSSEVEEFGQENDVLAGMSLALIGAKTKKIYEDIDLAVSYYPQAQAYTYRNRACLRIRRAMVGSGALSLLLLIPNENNAPRVLEAQDFQNVINELRLVDQDLCQ